MSGEHSPTQPAIQPSAPSPQPASMLQQSIRSTSPRVVIGRGAFGEVTEAFDISSGRIVAVKHLALVERDGTRITQEQVQGIVAEISVMKKLNHPNIVKYIGAFRSDAELSIVMEYIAAGSVGRVIQRYGKLPESVVRIYTRDMVRGLAYLHLNKVAHRDVKCENLLLCSTGVIKLSDFGSSKELVGEDVASTLTGTPLFMAPEVAINSGGYDPFLADIWTVGITVVQMLEGEPPFAGRFKKPLEAVLHVAQSKDLPPIPAGISEECSSFLSQCIVRDPAGRTPAADLLQHPFIAQREGEAQRLPEPPSTPARPVVPPVGRPSSGGRPSLTAPRPPSAQRVSPGGDEVRQAIGSSRPGSTDPFAGRSLVARPSSSSSQQHPTSFGSLSGRGKSPRPHHLPSLADNDNDQELPRPPSEDRDRPSARRPAPPS